MVVLAARRRWFPQLPPPAPNRADNVTSNNSSRATVAEMRRIVSILFTIYSTTTTSAIAYRQSCRMAVIPAWTTKTMTRRVAITCFSSFSAQRPRVKPEEKLAQSRPVSAEWLSSRFVFSDAHSFKQGTEFCSDLLGHFLLYFPFFRCSPPARLCPSLPNTRKAADRADEIPQHIERVSISSFGWCQDAVLSFLSYSKLSPEILEHIFHSIRISNNCDKYFFRRLHFFMENLYKLIYFILIVLPLQRTNLFYWGSHRRYSRRIELLTPCSLALIFTRFLLLNLYEAFVICLYRVLPFN